MTILQAMLLHLKKVSKKDLKSKKQKQKGGNNNNNKNNKKAGKQTIKAPKGCKIGRKTVWEQYDSVWETSQVR